MESNRSADKGLDDEEDFKENGKERSRFTIETSDGKLFRFSKTTLMRSEYFNALLKGHWKDSREPTLFVEVSAADFVFIHDLMVYGSSIMQSAVQQMNEHTKAKFMRNCSFFGLEFCSPKSDAKDIQRVGSYKENLCHLCQKNPRPKDSGFGSSNRFSSSWTRSTFGSSSKFGRPSFGMNTYSNLCEPCRAKWDFKELPLEVAKAQKEAALQQEQSTRVEIDKLYYKQREHDYACECTVCRGHQLSD